MTVVRKWGLQALNQSQTNQVWYMQQVQIFAKEYNTHMFLIQCKHKFCTLKVVLLSKVICLQRLSLIKGHFQLKDILNWRSSGIEVCLPLQKALTLLIYDQVQLQKKENWDKNEYLFNLYVILWQNSAHIRFRHFLV